MMRERFKNMKAIILAGGYGTRISEESYLKPKPMIEIGGKPILWHIMKIYSHYGINEFIVCAGYKQHVIKQWFSDYFIHNSDITFDFTNEEEIIIHNRYIEPWKVTIVDTGLDTMTGGRIKKIETFVGNETFCLTYGDGLSDVNIEKLIDFHYRNAKIATLTSVQPEGRFGVLDIVDNYVESFREKNNADMGWINGGFMVLENDIFSYLENDDAVFELDCLEKLAKQHQLVSYKHKGFWQCMDTLRDQKKLEGLWQENKAPWKLWK